MPARVLAPRRIAVGRALQRAHALGVLRQRPLKLVVELDGECHRHLRKLRRQGQNYRAPKPALKSALDAASSLSGVTLSGSTRTIRYEMWSSILVNQCPTPAGMITTSPGFRW